MRIAVESNVLAVASLKRNWSVHLFGVQGTSFLPQDARHLRGAKRTL